MQTKVEELIELRRQKIRRRVIETITNMVVDGGTWETVKESLDNIR